jgi:hypothetical protein
MKKWKYILCCPDCKRYGFIRTDMKCRCKYCGFTKYPINNKKFGDHQAIKQDIRKKAILDKYNNYCD